MTNNQTPNTHLLVPARSSNHSHKISPRRYLRNGANRSRTRQYDGWGSRRTHIAECCCDQEAKSHQLRQSRVVPLAMVDHRLCDRYHHATPPGQTVQPAQEENRWSRCQIPIQQSQQRRVEFPSPYKQRYSHQRKVLDWRHDCAPQQLVTRPIFPLVHLLMVDSFRDHCGSSLFCHPIPIHLLQNPS